MGKGIFTSPGTNMSRLEDMFTRKFCGNKDLNTLTEPGVYACTSSGHASLALNFPVEYKGFLVVFKHDTLGAIQQIYYVSKGTIYVRTHWDNSWCAWIKLATASDITAVQNSVSANASSITAINNQLAQKTGGRFVLSNGLKICWGTVNTTNANGYVRTATINFPIRYGSQPTLILSKHEGSNGSQIIGTSVCVNSVSVAAAIITAQNMSQAIADYNIPINWVAIGY